MRQPDAAPRRPARPARRQPHRRAAAARARRARRRRRRCARRWPRCSTTPSGARAPASRRSTDGTRTAARRARGAPTATSSCALTATVDGDELTLDFTGTRRRSTTATSTARSRSRARACCFAVRVLTDPDIPPSAGALPPDHGDRARGLAAQRALARRGRRPATSRRPRASPTSCSAAFGRALGQGTMNNLTLGNDDVHLLRDARRRPGRLPGRRRARAACTSRCRNTLNTPVEALELEFPLRVDRVRAAPRLGRRRRATAAATASSASSRRSPPMSYSLLTERRRHAPPGADGGEPGARGRNLLDGEELPPKASGTLRSGQRLRIETPGAAGTGRCGGLSSRTEGGEPPALGRARRRTSVLPCLARG